MIRHELQNHSQVDTLYVVSRSEERKRVQAEEKPAKRPLLTLLMQSAIFLALLIGSIILMMISYEKKLSGPWFIASMMFFCAIGSLIWLIPTVKGFIKRR